ncbi:MAG: methyltransferase domain-containing protein [Gemmatimonadota bacterium]
MVGKIRPRLNHQTTNGLVKVNVGAGLTVAPGWINVDGNIHSMLASAPTSVLHVLYRLSNTVHWLERDEYVRRLRNHAFIHYDLERGLPLADAAADFVYSSHVLEHFYLADARRLVAEMLRILKPGGTLRLCVPDLEHAMRLYQNGNRRDALEYFFTNDRAPYFRQHRYMYDFELIAGLLRDAGFSSVTRYSYQHGRVPDLELLDNRSDETLYVEATR